MRILIIVATAVALAAAPCFAQTERGYVAASGGFAVSPGGTSGDILAEAGVRVAPHILVFGDLGRFHNLQPSEIQPAVDTTTATLSESNGLNVVGTARVPAWHSIGGLRFEVPTTHALPYVFGGVGFARLMPTARFTYTSGTLPDATTPNVGDDVTTQVVSAGAFTQPPATTDLMFSLGGGVAVPVARHVTANADYRFSRVAVDTPLRAQAVTFGLGYRF